MELDLEDWAQKCKDYRWYVAELVTVEMNELGHCR